MRSSDAITVGGQQGWAHDEGFEYGTVHTFDALVLPRVDPRPRKVHVLVPHARQPGERFPVVYVNDGHTALFAGGPGGKSLRAAEALASLTSSGAIPRVLLVALHPVDRDHEYTHAPWFPGSRFGGLPQYAEYVAGPLREWVGASYPTDTDPRLTACVGSSHGGLAAFYTACRYPERFGLVGAQSPSFWVGRGDDGSRITEPLAPSLLMQRTGPTLRNRATRPKIWIDWGLNGDGGRHGAREMATLLLEEYGYQAGRDLFVHEDPPAGHDEKAWAYRFPLMLRSLYSAYG